MSAEIKTLHIFRCFCGKEKHEECVNSLDHPAIMPTLPRGWKRVGGYIVCPDEKVQLKITDSTGKRIWFENDDWMGE